jgi:hypothetical protein
MGSLGRGKRRKQLLQQGLLREAAVRGQQLLRTKWQRPW